MLLEEPGHMKMLDLGWDALADRIIAWLEESFR
jgi:hypothetical protein